MINIRKTVRVSGKEPFSIIVNTNATHSVAQLSDDLFQINLTYNTEEDIDGSDTVTVFDSIGCIKSFPLQVTNICDDFIVSEITTTSNVTNIGEQQAFTITSNQDIDVVWSIDDPEYYNIQIEGNDILLTQILSGIQSTQLRATVTNEAGCEETRRLQLNPCRVLAQPVTRVLYLRDEGNYTASSVPLRASSSCQDSNIDWTTVRIFNTPSISFQQINNGPLFNISSNTPFSTTRIQYQVRDNNGLLSNISYIELSTEEEYSGIGTGSTDGFASEPTVTTFSEDNFTIPLNSLGLPTTTDFNNLTINNTLTTATSASISNQLLTVDFTGQQTASVGFNQPNDLPLITTFVRELGSFTAPAQELIVTCSTSTLDVTTVGDITGATEILSGEAVLNGNIVSIDEPNQVVLVNVVNSSNQSTTLRINSCGGCIPTTNVTLCNDTVNLYSLLPDTANPNGVWSVVGGGGALPNTYDADIALVGTGSFSYSYASPNTAGDYNCVVTSTHVLAITKVAASNASNDDCANSTALPSVTDDQTILSVSEINNACSNETTWSGNAGNKTVHTYDQWYSFDSNSTDPLDTLKLTVRVIGIGSTPLVIPDLQLWSSCATVLGNVTYSQTTSTATAVYNLSGGANTSLLLQVLANNTGDYRIEIQQEII